jgi:hypothetical protein
MKAHTSNKPPVFLQTNICRPRNAGDAERPTLHRSALNSGVIFVKPLLPPGFHRPRLAGGFAGKTTLSVTVFKIFYILSLLIKKVKG